MSTLRVGPGPLRRGGAAAVPDLGLNYAAIGATGRPDVIPFPPSGFHSAEYRHRIGSGPRRFDLAGRALMTWGALRSAGYRVDEVQAEPAAHAPRGTGPLFLEDGSPWITAGMTATVTSTDTASTGGRVKVLSVIDEPGRIGFLYGSMAGNTECAERFLVVEHDDQDAVWVTLRSLWEAPSSRISRRNKAADVQQRRIDERIVRALHPSNVA